MTARPYYGWVVVASAFTLTFVGFGTAYSFAAFFGAFQTEFAASRAHVSLVFSIAGSFAHHHLIPQAHFHKYRVIGEAMRRSEIFPGSPKTRFITPAGTPRGRWCCGTW